MVKQATIRKRPELIELPAVPTVLKVSEIPTGIFVLRINQPFNLTHLVKRGVKKAFIVSRTGKSARTLLGEEIVELETLKANVLSKIKAEYPVIAKNVSLSIMARISLGYITGPKGGGISPKYVADTRKLMETLDQCGFSDMPLQWFRIPVTFKGRQTWITFQRQKGAFIMSQLGNSPYSEFDLDDVKQMRRENKVLQDLKSYICETAEATGKFTTCLIPEEASE